MPDPAALASDDRPRRGSRLPRPAEIEQPDAAGSSRVSVVGRLSMSALTRLTIGSPPITPTRVALKSDSSSATNSAPSVTAPDDGDAVRGEEALVDAYVPTHFRVEHAGRAADLPLGDADPPDEDAQFAA